MLETTPHMRDSSNMTADPLSDLLDLVRARCGISGRLTAGGVWARRFENLNAVKFCAAVKGKCWYFMEGMSELARFTAGDIVVMNGTRSLILASDPDLAANAPSTPMVQDSEGAYRLGHGDDFAMLGGSVYLDERQLPLLLSGLPSILFVPGSAHAAESLGWLLGQIAQEMQIGDQPGRTMIVAELAQLLFVKTLRAYLTVASPRDSGWLKGLGDKQLAPALSSMHTHPGRSWSIEELAQEAAMSRTSFAVRFREVMGMPPLAYLTNWRMHLAERALRSGASVAEAAAAVGYTSESAFSHAFKRTMGIAPGQCRRDGEAPSAKQIANYLEATHAASL